MRKKVAVKSEPVKLLFNKRARCAMALFLSFWLMGGLVAASARQRLMPITPVYAQAGGTVTVTVSSTGCSPSSATHAAGQITLKVVNQTGRAELSVQLFGSQGELIREVTIKEGTAEWSETLELKAGSYTLIAGNRPEWRCALTVQ